MYLADGMCGSQGLSFQSLETTYKGLLQLKIIVKKGSFLGNHFTASTYSSSIPYIVTILAVYVLKEGRNIFSCGAYLEIFLLRNCTSESKCKGIKFDA